MDRSPPRNGTGQGNFPHGSFMNIAIQMGFGFTLIVVFISLVLLGTVLSQVYTYYVSYPSDRLWMKLFVALILLIEVVYAFYSCTWEFVLLISRWGDQAAFVDSFWILSLNPLLCAIAAFSVHCFFAWRIYIITTSKIMTGLIGVFALIAIGGAISSAFIAFESASHIAAPSALKAVASCWLVASVLADVSITLALTYHFRKVKQETMQLAHILNRILRSTVQNGFLTSMVALLDFLLFMINGTPNHTVSFLMPHLYANTVLSSLNARPITVERRGETVERSTYFTMSKMNKEGPNDILSPTSKFPGAFRQDSSTNMSWKADTTVYGESPFQSRAVTPAPSALPSRSVTPAPSTLGRSTVMDVEAEPQFKPQPARSQSSELLVPQINTTRSRNRTPEPVDRRSFPQNSFAPPIVQEQPLPPPPPPVAIASVTDATARDRYLPSFPVKPIARRTDTRVDQTLPQSFTNPFAEDRPSRSIDLPASERPQMRNRSASRPRPIVAAVAVPSGPGVF